MRLLVEKFTRMIRKEVHNRNLAIDIEIEIET